MKYSPCDIATYGMGLAASMGQFKAILKPACQQVLDKKLAPTMAVIKRIQTDIAHAHAHGGDAAAQPVRF